MKKYSIEVKYLSKTFYIPMETRDSLQQRFINIFKPNKKRKFKVLNNISFNIKKGDWVGLIGRNGSGKSTLLKILSGIYLQDSGKIKIRGRVVQFLELGVGFNPDLSGRENIYLNGIVMGMKRKEIESKFDTIVEFADIKKFLDLPLKNYSSGMKLRLAFAVAANIEADIYLLDEVLAVGDMNFQKKSLAVFNELKKQKKTVILVSHNMDQIRDYCNKIVLLEAGSAWAYKDSEEGIRVYRDIINANTARKSCESDVTIGDIRIVDENDLPILKIKSGKRLFVGYTLKSNTDKNVDIVTGVEVGSKGVPNILSAHSEFNNNYVIGKFPKDKRIRVRISFSLPLSRGYYNIRIAVARKDAAFTYKTIIDTGDSFGISIVSNSKWGLLDGNPEVEIL